ncbi:MAG: PhnE/PtxC family ABC transporter permease [Rectinemataceae bacterium]
MTESRSKDPPKNPKPIDPSKLAIRITLATLAAITVYAFLTMDYGSANIREAAGETLRNFGTIFFQPHSHRLSLTDAFLELVTTIALAVLTTVFSGLVALFLGLLGARNLAPKGVSSAIKGIVAFIRAIPSILWVLIFAVAAGLGSTAAVIGLSMHSIGYLTKAYAESFESLDQSVIEALKASGADWWQIVFRAVLPASSTYLLSWTFLRFEMNFTNVVAMGAAAGAAGIGFDLFMASSLYFDLRELGLIVYFVMAFAILLEIVAIRVKKNLKEG